jgi:hypothetical protein
MNADELKRRQAELAAARPFVELGEVCLAMREHLQSVQAGAAKVADALLYDRHESVLDSGIVTIREHVLDDYAKLRDELHACVDAVMRTPQMDRPTSAPPEPAPPAKEPADA